MLLPSRCTRGWIGTVLAAFLLLSIGGPARGVTVQYLATDLDDSLGPGGDFWKIAYLVTDFAYPAGVSFAISFDRLLYSDLEDPPPPVNADWSPLVLQPDPLLMDDGLYDALALVANPSLADPFELTFQWLGAPGSQPGSQPFRVDEFDEEGNFVQTLETGVTVPIPEPGTAALLGVGLLLGACLRRAR